MSQPKLVVDPGVYASLNVNYHYQIIYAKFSLLQTYYLLNYERIVWYYNHSNMNHIRKAIFSFNWERSFENKNVNEMVKISNETIMF